VSHSRAIWALAAALSAVAATTGCLKVTADLGGCSPTSPGHNYTLGDTATDSLTSEICSHLYSFTVTGQANVRIRFSSPQTQTYLQLYDSRGAIVMNSAVVQAPDTTTTMRMMLGDGSYGLVVLPLSRGQSSPFTLSVVPDSSAVSGCNPVWVTTGVTTTQTLTPLDCTQGPAGAGFYTHVYLLVLLANQTTTITENSSALAPAVYMAGPSGTITSTPDSTGAVATVATLVSTQGAYTLWVGAATQGQAGKYTLQIQ